MNKLKSLTLIQIKDFIGRAQESINVKNNKLARLLQVALVFILAIPAINFSILTFDAFAKLNHPELMITTMYVNAVMLMFFLGLPFIVSVFFFARDLKFLTALPVREDTIVFAKLSTVYIYLLGITLIFMGPAFIVYIIKIGLTLQFFLLGLLVLLLAPVLPLLISALLVLLLNRFLIDNSRRNLFTILSNFLLLIAIIFIQMTLTRYLANPEFIQKALVTKEGLLGLVGLRFPPSIWMTRMLMGSPRYGLYFIGLNVVFFFILQSLARLFFRRALMAYSQDVSRASGKIYYRQHSQGYQLLKRNILIILKQPTFFMNTFLTILVPVIMFLVLSISGQFSLEMLNNPGMKPFLILIFTGIITSPAIVGNTSATAITREGQAFWETKVLPIKAADNIRYRVLTTVLISLFGSALLLTVSAFIMPLTVKMIMLGSFFCLGATLFLSTVDIIIDIYRPILNWTNPTAAVKNNMNITVSLGIRALLALVVYLIYRIAPGFIMSFDTAILWGGIVFFILYFAVRYYVYNYLDKVFLNISI
ncbi:putative ABC transporter permease subunit [Halothermothrix orenii]|uniref:ABC-2 type transport system permease protein n=1 Tax=Halothermothrix orenii (strain H 168 / OCM 544 / DSM 9562) TaxID=373903 RepID=B8CYB0_HALOH|nr:hypothetical protein [Halothermothrix orenii]ACL70279.1 hypothetical protein Hore_15300 [Halothermothrix orenii H 168]